MLPRRLVLDSLGRVTGEYKEQSRFHYLVTCLSDSRFAFEFRVMTMSLINGTQPIISFLVLSSEIENY